MKPFDTLTEAGKIRRLRPLAMAALAEFDVDVQRLRLVGGFTNVVYRVDTPQGPRALRVDLSQEHTDRDVRVEVEWLTALAADTDLDVVQHIPASDGRPFVSATAPGIPGERRCTLFDWVPGRPLGENPSIEAYHRLGAIAAALHRHGATHRGSERPMVWDRIFYWPGDPVVINSPDHQHIITSERRKILDQAIPRVEQALAKLDEIRLQIVHGDIHPENVHVVRTRPYILDFEDVMWADPAQDIAITLFYDRDQPWYADCREAYEAGYRSVAEWPVAYDGQLESFMAARSIMFIDYVLKLDGDHSEFFERVFGRLTRYLAS